MVEQSQSPRKKELIVGLTGGLASGKSTVARFFSEQGLTVIDADQVARAVSSPGGRAHADLIKAFGTSDRAELAKIVFADSTARKKIEAILHPAIQKESDEQIKAALADARAQSKPAIVIYDAALLIEIGRAKEFEVLVCVVAGADTQKARAKARDPQRSDREIEAILAAQTTDKERVAKATYVIENKGSVDDLKQATQSLALQLKSLVK